MAIDDVRPLVVELEHRAEKWMPVIGKNMRKQKAGAIRPIPKSGGLL
jgi:hypothetical protein